MKSFAEYAFNKITEYNSFTKAKKKRTARGLSNPNPFGGQWWSSMYCIYRINRDDIVRGTCWNAPSKRRRPGAHAEENFFAELEDALTVNAAPTSVEVIITRSPCYDQCWQMIKRWAARLPGTKFSVLFCGIYNPDTVHTVAADPDEIRFGSFEPAPKTYFSMLQTEEITLNNVWITLLNPTKAADIERALDSASTSLASKANAVLMIHPLAAF